MSTRSSVLLWCAIIALCFCVQLVAMLEIADMISTAHLALIALSKQLTACCQYPTSSVSTAAGDQGSGQSVPSIGSSRDAAGLQACAQASADSRQ